MQFYDPTQLVREVRELLHAHGLTSVDDVTDKRLAITGASMLLRGLGITPGMDSVDALARAMDKPWVEADDQAAAHQASSG